MTGFILGAFGEIPTQVRDLADFVACELSAEHPALFDIAKNESKGISTKQTRRSIGLVLHRGRPNCFSAGAVTSPKAHGSRVPTHAKQAGWYTPRHMTSFYSTNAPARTRGLAGCISWIVDLVLELELGLIPPV